LRISGTHLDWLIDHFISDMKLVYSVRLMVLYGKADKQLYRFPPEMRELLLTIGERVEKAMRGDLRQVNFMLQKHTTGEDET
jgi:hypothetical protein